jgi:hypothetical protein
MIRKKGKTLTNGIDIEPINDRIDESGSDDMFSNESK